MGDKELTEKKLAFEICDTNKAGTLDKEQCYNYLCALGLTPSQQVRQELPASADEAAAIALYDKYIADPTCGPFESEAVQQWFETWDAKKTGVLDTKNLKGELDDGVEPLTADEVLSAPTHHSRNELETCGDS